MSQEYKNTPVRNRGPGAMTRQESGSARKRLSFMENEKNSKTFEANAASESGRALKRICLESLGTSGTDAAYIDGRHLMGPKGRVIPPHTQTGVDSVFGAANTARMEATARQVLPKYNVGPGNPIGTNNCPKMNSSRKNLVIALSNGFREPVENTRAMRMASLGVSFFNAFENELLMQGQEDWVVARNMASANAGGGAAGAAAAAAVPPPVPPTDNETKAAMQLAITLSWINRGRAPANYIPVQKDPANIGTGL